MLSQGCSQPAADGKSVPRAVITLLLLVPTENTLPCATNKENWWDRHADALLTGGYDVTELPITLFALASCRRT